MIQHIPQTQDDWVLLDEYRDWRIQNGYEPTSQQIDQLARWGWQAEDAFGGGFLPLHVLLIA